MKLNTEEIKILIPHRDPFLFVDTFGIACLNMSAISCVCFKIVSPYFVSTDMMFSPVCLCRLLYYINIIAKLFSDVKFYFREVRNTYLRPITGRGSYRKVLHPKNCLARLSK